MAQYEVLKPWGKEDVIEVNEQYMFKRLEMHAGHQCSLQRHHNKKETFYLLSGEMELIIEDATGTLVPIQIKPGQSYTINPMVKHRMRAITNIVYFECSTPHPDDVERLQDDYQR